MSTTAQNVVSKSFRDASGRERTVYYPCSREQFLELKEFHRQLLRAWVEHKRWARWCNKTVRRSGPEPAHFPGLSRLVGALPAFGQRGWYAQQTYGVRLDNLYLHVLGQYRLARRPRAEPDEVPILRLPEGWQDLLAALRGHYDK